MEKLKMHSANLTQDNIARIRDLCRMCAQAWVDQQEPA